MCGDLGNWWMTRGMDVSTFIPLPEKVILNSVQITKQLLLSPMQARFFVESYWKDPSEEWRPKRKLQTNRRDSDKEGGQEIKSRISEYWCTRHASTNNDSICALWTSLRSTLSPVMGYPLHLIVLLAKLYRKQLTKVKVAGTLSEWFHVNKGVRQGCVLSPANLRIDDGERTKQTKRIVSAAAILWNAKYF